MESHVHPHCGPTIHSIGCSSNQDVSVATDVQKLTRAMFHWKRFGKHALSICMFSVAFFAQSAEKEKSADNADNAERTEYAASAERTERAENRGKSAQRGNSWGS